MNFPKPTSVSTTTLKDYAQIFIRRQRSAVVRYPNDGFVDLLQRMDDDLVADRPRMTRSTFRKYRSAFLWTLMYFANMEANAPFRDGILKVRESIAKELPTGALKRSNRTSSKKARSVSTKVVEQIRSHLLENPTGSEFALPTASALTILDLTGIRPCELNDLALAIIGDNGIDLDVRTAKRTNGRGLDDRRIISLRGLTELEFRLVRSWPSHLDALIVDCLPIKAIRKLTAYFKDAGQRVLGPNMKAPCFYTFRHQVSADMKSVDFVPAETAAVMGHASDRTQLIHYARRVSGRGKVKVTPDAKLVAKVRRSAKAFYGRNSPKSRRS